MRVTHLAHLTSETGLASQCVGLQPNDDAESRVVDVARAAVTLLREPELDPQREWLLGVYLRFLGEAQDVIGRVVSECRADGCWDSQSVTAEAWGHALWAWGSAVRRSRDADVAARAYDRFCLSAQLESLDVRAMSFAVLGATQVLEALPSNEPAMSIVNRAIDLVQRSTDERWVWPEPGLEHTNAAVAEMMMLAGFYAGRPDIAHRGRRALEWLWELQQIAGRLSMVPAKGWQPGDALPAFDQHPIEVAAFVDACCTAYDLTSDPIWKERALVGRRWFDGNNDQGLPMYDPDTGAGYAALTVTGRSPNASAAGTVAFLSVQQRTACLFTAVS